MEMLHNKLGINVHCVDAQKLFLHALKGVIDPEQKRKIIGREFIAVFEKEAKKYGDIKWLAQGTIYPDVIESSCAQSSKSHVIKSHHNVGGLPENMHLSIIEPLRDLFKDEVRKIGKELGISADILLRHPFPGPGLAIRIIGEITHERLRILRHVDHILIEELRKNNLYHKTSQALAVLLPIKSVGIKGDARHYGYGVALRAVKTDDFMTASWVNFPPEFLRCVSNRITNEVKEISRVVYDISSKPPATIEWE